MERALQSKTAVLVANSTVSLTWTGPDIQRAFPESVIRKEIALRLTCFSTTVKNGVFIGASYTTLTKTYQLAERLTIGTIPAGGSVELTAASIPAFGRLFENLTSLTVSLTSPVVGNVTIIPIIDDEPPPLSADVGERIGLDAAVATNDIIISNFGSGNMAVGGVTGVTTWYTVPVGKRFYIDTLVVNIGPTGSYPATAEVIVAIYVNGIQTNIIFFSETERFAQTFIPPISMPLIAGDHIDTLATNNSATVVPFYFTLQGREVF